MDFLTQLFLTNWIAIICMMVLDNKVFNDAIEDHPFWSPVAGLWAIISFATIPYWLLHLIWT